MRAAFFLAVFCLAEATTAAHANFLVEPTYAEQMHEADLVVIGTVTAVTGRQGQEGSSAHLSVLQALKGEPEPSIDVATYSRTAEDGIRCCEVGATYLMFLLQPRNGGSLVAVRGHFSMIRIGGPPNPIQVIERGTGND